MMFKPGPEKYGEIGLAPGPENAGEMPPMGLLTTGVVVSAWPRTNDGDPSQATAAKQAKNRVLGFIVATLLWRPSNRPTRSRARAISARAQPILEKESTIGIMLCLQAKIKWRSLATGQKGAGAISLNTAQQSLGVGQVHFF
jgi:hypothetical protein